jgi:hypothetical protein
MRCLSQKRSLTAELEEGLPKAQDHHLLEIPEIGVE